VVILEYWNTGMLELGEQSDRSHERSE